MRRSNRGDDPLVVEADHSFRIYVAGQGRRSRQAVVALRRLCAVHVPDGHDIEVVDVLAQPGLAARERVIATPAVVRLSPPPVRRVLGDLADSGRAAIALGLVDDGHHADVGAPPGRAHVDGVDLRETGDVDQGREVTDLRHRFGPDLTAPVASRHAARGLSRGLPVKARPPARAIPEELLNAVAGGVIVVDDGGTVLLCNAVAEKTFCRPGVDLLGLELGLPLSSDGVVVDVVTPDGSARAVEVRSTETTWGQVRAHVLAVREVTDQDRIHAGAGESGFREVFDQSPVGLALLDSELRFRVVNGALARMLAYNPLELTGLTLVDVTLPADRDEEIGLAGALLAGDCRSYELEKQYVTGDNELIWGHVTASVFQDSSGPPSRIIAVIEDVTARKDAHARLAHLALHDPLTGLANRALAMDRLHLAQARAERTGQFAAVLFLDLDHFKAINDTLGHDAGNAYLVECARRLEGVLRPSDTASRLGGDEFLVVCEGLGTNESLAKAKAVEVAERVAATLARPVTLANGRAEATASIGIALTKGNDLTVDVLLRRADAAMYRAKDRDGSVYELFDEAHQAEAAGRLQMAEALRRALALGELVVHYQPIVSLEDRRIVGVEAVVRWNHPRLGMLLPAAFIDVAEESNLIIPLGDAVLLEACTRLAAWRRTVRPDLVVMVNASARQLGCNVLGASVASALCASGLEPDALHIELTEGTLIEASGSTLAELKELRGLGVHLGLDDFGTGYASLTYLQRLPVDFVKIDGSFVAGVAESVEDRAIIEAVIGLGHALGLRVIAEGIEAEGQKKALEEMGCVFGQGWHFGYPQPAADLTHLLMSSL